MADARLVVLGHLEAVECATARELEYRMLSCDETRLSSYQVEVMLRDLARDGLASAGGPVQRPAYLITELGREQLRAERS